MNNPFALILMFIIVFCVVKKRKLAFLGLPDNELLRKSRILRIALPLLGIIIAMLAIYCATFEFYTPVISQLK